MSNLVPWRKPLDCNLLRRTVLRMSMAGNSVHLGSSFSIVELVATLYQDFIRIDWQCRENPNRDILALSKGHGVMALYSVLFEFGWISEEQIDGYFSATNLLKGLSSANVSGIDISGGSLGHGITVATGMALAAKLKRIDQRVFTIVGDGEADEGSVWESLLIASHFKLNNLFVIFDVNKFQAMGESKPGSDLFNFEDKLKSFKFDTRVIDGHDRNAISTSIESMLTNNIEMPKAIIASTIKGKGVSFMENDNNWHYLRLNEENYSKALDELSR